LVFLIHTELRCTVNHTSDVKQYLFQCIQNGGRAPPCLSPLHTIVSVNIFMRGKKEMCWFRTSSLDWSLWWKKWKLGRV